MTVNINGNNFEADVLEVGTYYKHKRTGNFLRIMETAPTPFGLAVEYEWLNVHAGPQFLSRTYPNFDRVFCHQGAFVEIQKDEYNEAMSKWI